jgi:hypothetical protein
VQNRVTPKNPYASASPNLPNHTPNTSVNFGTLPAAIGAGGAYGLLVWTTSYLGRLPPIGARHRARHDSPSRMGMMIAAHVVWGATLGLVLSSRPGLRLASRHPDTAEA